MKKLVMFVMATIIVIAAICAVATISQDTKNVTANTYEPDLCPYIIPVRGVERTFWLPCPEEPDQCYICKIDGTCFPGRCPN